MASWTSPPKSFLPLSWGCRFFPLRNDIFPASRTFFASAWYFFCFRHFFRFGGVFANSPGIFIASARGIFPASEMIFSVSKRIFFRAEKYFSCFRFFLASKKIFFLLPKGIFSASARGVTKELPARIFPVFLPFRRRNSKKKSRKQTVSTTWVASRQKQAKTSKNK